MSNKNHLVYKILVLSIALSTGCTHINATRNTEISSNENAVKTKASFVISEDRGVAKEKGLDGTLVVLALSGGGSRAAYWSAEVMLNLQKVFKNEKYDELDLLKEVDAISSVSGGSLPAAYYVISKDPDDKSGAVESGRDWDVDTVRELMSNDYITRWFYNWFWPSNIAQYWFTGFDRSDIMAQTFADNLFDVSITGWDLKFKDINPERPNLILNATNGTGDDFGNSFTFTDKVFHRDLKSQLSEYDIAWAVMATASFPAVFNYMTLENFYAKDDKKYVHVFDGGNTDNLGLISAQEVIKKNLDKYKKFVVILVDAFTETRGINRKRPDAREYFDFAIDTNFLDSTDSLLARVRTEVLGQTKDYLRRLGKRVVFYHIQFSDIAGFGDKESKILNRNLNKISTNFKIGEDQIEHIEKAASKLIASNNKCLAKIKSIILDTDKSAKKYTDCHWPISKKANQQAQSVVNVVRESAR